MSNELVTFTCEEGDIPSIRDQFSNRWNGVSPFVVIFNSYGLLIKPMPFKTGETPPRRDLYKVEVELCRVVSTDVGKVFYQEASDHNKQTDNIDFAAVDFRIEFKWDSCLNFTVGTGQVWVHMCHDETLMDMLGAIEAARRLAKACFKYCSELER